MVDLKKVIIRVSSFEVLMCSTHTRGKLELSTCVNATIEVHTVE